MIFTVNEKVLYSNSSIEVPYMQASSMRAALIERPTNYTLFYSFIRLYNSKAEGL